MTTYNDALKRYNADLFAKHDEALRLAWEDTPKRGLPAINVQPEEGRFLQVMARACGAKKAVEIGTLGGYSGIWIARGLLPGGKLITLEVEEHHAQVARDHFAAAGLSNAVEVRVGNAHRLLQKMSNEGPFDFVFIDAEKDGYPDYYDWALENLRVGGMVTAHNAFRGGRVVDESVNDPSIETTRKFNRRAAGDPRTLSVIYPAGDGTLVAVKVAQDKE
jgi:predicted O-methyltransferase YrrM